MKPHDLKKIVKDKYSLIAKQSDKTGAASCCSPSCCSTDADYSTFSDNYENLTGYAPDADLGLGCGLPTEFAQIKEGDTVVDLGSGAGNDCFVARALTGDSGRVIGIDMTEAMIEKARRNTQKLGYTNVEFHLGDIEELPLPNDIADVIVSNCVLNLVPDKAKAFAEIYRILKPGGHLSVSDVVLRGELPEKLQQAAEMYAGCVSGAILVDDYLQIMENAGLAQIQVQKEKVIEIPDSVYFEYLSEQELAEFKQSGAGIYSITVYAEKR
ncbi:MAG: arsenite methyltransferase [Bacteroidota bacterium]|nr:arsenite methyltransferase [Bacteroidota bacterium]